MLHLICPCGISSILVANMSLCNLYYNLEHMAKNITENIWVLIIKSSYIQRFIEVQIITSPVFKTNDKQIVLLSLHHITTVKH